MHSHFADQGWYNLPLVKKYGMKHVVTFYGYDVNMLPTQQPIWRKRYSELFDRTDLFLCEGAHMAKCLVNLGCPREKIKVQRLGVELDIIPYVPRQIQDGDSINILIAGAFREKKGITYALEAIGVLKRSYPNLRITIIGDSGKRSEEEREKKKILDVIERYNLTPITRMLGFQPHHILMAEAYRHHIFLSPSVTASNGDTEGGVPVTIIEMAASGMPVVSTTHCDIPEVIHHDSTGLLAPERDVEALVHHLAWLIDHPQEWLPMVVAGRKHVEEEYNARVQGERLMEIYRVVATDLL